MVAIVLPWQRIRWRHIMTSQNIGNRPVRFLHQKSWQPWSLGGKRWTFIMIAFEASRCSFTKQAYTLSELSKRSRPAACSDVPAALTAKKKGSHSIACRRTDVDMFYKTDVKAFLGRQNSRQREKTKMKKKENGHDEPNENLSDEKRRSDEKKLKTWLARMQKSHTVKQMLECVERLQRWTTKRLHTCIPSIFPWTKSATPRIPPEKRRRQLAVAFLRWEAKRKIDTAWRLPSFQVVDRQDGADGCAVSNTGPVETAANQVETDPAVESQGGGWAQLQRSADFPWLGKETNRKGTGEWNGKDLPTMCDKNVPAKTLATQRVSFWMRAMTCWAVPWRIDKGPIPVAIFLNHDAQSAAQTTRFDFVPSYLKARGWCQTLWLGFGWNSHAISQKSTSLNRRQYS